MHTFPIWAARQRPRSAVDLHSARFREFCGNLRRCSKLSTGVLRIYGTAPKVAQSAHLKRAPVKVVHWRAHVFKLSNS
jgi:hypothetical protein